MEAEYAAYVLEMAELNHWLHAVSMLAFFAAFSGSFLAGAVKAARENEGLWIAVGLVAGLLVGLAAAIVPAAVSEYRSSAIQVKYADAIAWAQTNRGVTIKEAE